MRKLTALVAAGVGYVLGARAGRQRYEQLRQAATRVRSNPKVQQTTQQAADAAKGAAPVIKEKVGGAATAVTSKVGVGSSSDSSTTTSPSTSTTPTTATTATPSSPSGAPLSPPPVTPPPV